jgi:hypothetical protein
MPQRKSDSTSGPHEDAPKLPDKPSEDENPPAKSDVVDAQAQPMDEQESPVTEGETSGEGAATLTIMVPGVPTAEEVGEPKEGEHDPSLVEIPGLGTFRNGTTTELGTGRMQLFAEHMRSMGLTSPMRLPVGVNLKVEGQED